MDNSTVSAGMPGRAPSPLTEQDNELVRAAFDKDGTLLRAMRAVMLNLDPTPDEKSLVANAFASDDLHRIVSKKFWPTIDKSAPIGVMSDVWMGVEQMVFGAARDTIYQAVKYKQIALELTARALKLLKNPDDTSFPPIDVTYDPLAVDIRGGEDAELQTWLLGRNQFLRHVETQLLFIEMIVKTTPPTPAEAKAAAAKDSAK